MRLTTPGAGSAPSPRRSRRSQATGAPTSTFPARTRSCHPWMARSHKHEPGGERALGGRTVALDAELDDESPRASLDCSRLLVLTRAHERTRMLRRTSHGTPCSTATGEARSTPCSVWSSFVIQERGEGVAPLEPLAAASVGSLPLAAASLRAAASRRSSNLTRSC